MGRPLNVDMYILDTSRQCLPHILGQFALKDQGVGKLDPIYHRARYRYVTDALVRVARER